MTRISPETLHLVSAAMRDTLNHSWESEADKVFHAARWIYELEADLAAAQADKEACGSLIDAMLAKGKRIEAEAAALRDNDLPVAARSMEATVEVFRARGAAHD